MRKLKTFILALLRYVPVFNRMLLASVGHRLVTRQIAEKGLDGWHVPSAAARQQRAYEKLMAQFRAGAPRRDLRVAVEAVTATGLSNPTLLEVGCGNGYYSEVFRAVPGGSRYTGMDYSAAMVDSATRRYPGETFVTGDATAVAFGNGAFDIVVNGVSLMHIVRYREAIAEAARVAAHFVIFHCVPVSESGPTAFLSKFAYGQPVIEIIFSEQELAALFAASNLTLVRVWEAIDYDTAHITGHHSTMVTYLCRKVTA
jgi:ubiquinone/menaquinone biosynthesis C-methylase UbiE